MRIIVSVALESAQLPQEYRPLVTDTLIKAFQQEQVVTDYEKYFSDEIQPYSFSVYLPKSKFDKMIALESPKFKIIFSTCDQSCYDDFMKLFQALKGKSVHVAGNRWTFRGAMPVTEKVISNNQAHIRMMSPLIVARYERGKEGKRHLLGVNDANFEMHLQENVKELVQALGYHDMANAPIRIERCAEQYRSKEVHVLHDGHYLRSTVGDIILHGPSDLINLLYQSGFGEMRDKGFGLFEVVEG